MTELEKQAQFKCDVDAIDITLKQVHAQVVALLYAAKDINFKYPHMIHQIEAAMAEVKRGTASLNRYVANELIALASDRSKT